MSIERLLAYLADHDTGHGAIYIPSLNKIEVREYFTKDGETRSELKLIEPTAQAVRNWLGY